jgi:hypothetical protein
MHRIEKIFQETGFSPTFPLKKVDLLKTYISVVTANPEERRARIVSYLLEL